MEILFDLIKEEDTHKKSVFFSGRTNKVLPSLHLWTRESLD